MLCRGLRQGSHLQRGQGPYIVPGYPLRSGRPRIDCSSHRCWLYIASTIHGRHNASRSERAARSGQSSASIPPPNLQPPPVSPGKTRFAMKVYERLRRVSSAGWSFPVKLISMLAKVSESWRKGIKTDTPSATDPRHIASPGSLVRLFWPSVPLFRRGPLDFMEDASRSFVL